MKRIYFILLLSVAITACKENNEFEFDRTALLTELANNQIVPNYTNLKTAADDLSAKVSSFQTATTLENLTAVQTQFTATYLAFEKVKMFEFGPAANNNFRASMNTYPTNTTQINNNIVSGTYSLGSVENAAAIGLPAVDYLLFNGTSSEILLAFTSDENAANRMTYLAALVSKMATESATVLTTWNTSYKSTFIAANGTDIGSSLSLVFNQFVIDLELIKNAKIGIPSGQFSGGETFPTYVEGNFKGNSKELALTNLIALKNLFTGGTGVGIDDYMDESVEAGLSSVPSSMIIQQFEVCETKISAIMDPFSSHVSSDFDAFNVAFQELKKLVAYSKTDIPAALGVLISFSDSDGD